MFSIGVDIGGSHIASGMFEHSNKEIIKETLVSQKVDPKAPKDEILDLWASVISKTIEKVDVPIQGIGFAMPGPFNYYEGISLIANVDKLESLYGVNIREELAERLNIHPSKIRFINDASAFSIAEALIGKASLFDRTVAITLGTGIGSSFLVNAQPIINGSNVPAGGFLFNQTYKGQLADNVFSTRGIINQYRELSGKKVKNVQELCKLIPEDKEAQMVFSWFGTELGRFLKPYLLNFDAEVLVIGGNIAKAYAFFGDDLVKQLPEIEIYTSAFGEEAAIIGSALLADDNYYTALIPALKLM